MEKKFRLLLLLVLLMTAATGAWAQDAKHLITATYREQTRSLEQPLPYATTIGELYEAVSGQSFSDLISSMSSVGMPLTGITSTNTDVVSIGEVNDASTPVTVKADGKATIALRFGNYAQGIFVSAVPPLYVTMKDGVKDAEKWTVKVGEGQAQALPIGGLKGDGSETVTLQYNGRLKVKGVTATTDAGAPAAAMPMLTLGSMPNGGDPFSGSSGSETDFSPTFSEGQQVAVFYQNTSGHTVKVLSDALTASDISNEGKSATINVTIDDADKTQPVTYFYPATMTNDDYPSLMAKGSINFNFTAQSGTEASLSTVRNCCKGSGAWDGNALPSVSMASQIAIWKLTMTGGGGMIMAQKVTVKVGGNKVAEASTSGTYFAYPIDIYLALDPATMGTGTLRIEADEFGTIYYYQKDGGVSLTAGKFYQSAVELKR